jgi:SOS-response transcriptional repressor LexA
MKRLGRAGRKRVILEVLADAKKKRPRSGFSSGEIARRMGIRSSTYLRDLLHELEDDGRVERLSSKPRNGVGDEFPLWRIAVLEQTSLPERFIIINGMSMRAL